MEEKLSPLFSLKEVLSEDDAAKMGRKDPEEEVEKFVSANTQELGKDKWLCPLSGKKFKVKTLVCLLLACLVMCASMVEKSLLNQLIHVCQLVISTHQICFPTAIIG